jgi:hypothetical protein
MELNKKLVDDVLTQIAALDKRATEMSGTVSARKAEALETLRLIEVEGMVTVGLASNLEPLEDSEADPDEDWADHFPIHGLAVAAAELEAAKVRHEEAKQAVEDAIVTFLKAKKSDTGAELSTLKTQREELANTVRAMATLLKLDVEIPKAPKGSGGSSSGPRAAKSSTGAHYVRKEDGSTDSYANDSFSGLAFYAFKRAGVSDLKAALSANGVTELTKPWETTVTVNGITRTVGFRVEATPAE